MSPIGHNGVVFRMTNIPRRITHRTLHLTSRGLPIGAGVMGHGRVNNRSGRNW